MVDPNHVDEIGNEDQAVTWLENDKKVPANLPIQDWKPEDLTGRFGLAEGASSLARGLGLTAFANLIDLFTRNDKSLVLDGALVLWQPSLDISKP